VENDMIRKIRLPDQQAIRTNYQGLIKIEVV